MIFHIAICSPDGALRSRLEHQCMEFFARREDACIVEQLQSPEALLQQDAAGLRYELYLIELAAIARPEGLAAAAELLEYGADTGMVNVKFFRKASRARLKLEGMIYSTMGFYRDGKISVVIITKEMLRQAGAGEEDCDDLAGLAGRAEGASVNITIRERDNGSSKVSVRTGRDVSSSDICAVFGGGGHAMAAGCTIDCPPEKARDMLLAVIDEVWK